MEVSTIKSGFTYQQLKLRMEGEDIQDLIKLISPIQCAQVYHIEMSLALASVIHERIKLGTMPGTYASPWATDEEGDTIFTSLSRIVVTYPPHLLCDGSAYRNSLRELFGNSDLEVCYR